MIEVVATEAAKTVVGSTLGYFIGKWFGSKSKAERCRFLWNLEYEVSPRLLREVLEQEAKEGCIKREELDNRLWQILNVRAKYGLGYGANVFGTLSRSPSGQMQANIMSSVPPANTISTPKTNQDVIKREMLEAQAMQEVGPPSFLKKYEEKRKK